MPEWSWVLIGAVGAPLIGFVWQAFLTRESTERWGRLAGAVIAKFLRQRLGVTGGDSIRDRFRSTVADFWRGMETGLGDDPAKTATDARH